MIMVNVGYRIEANMVIYEYIKHGGFLLRLVFPLYVSESKNSSLPYIFQCFQYEPSIAAAF